MNTRLKLVSVVALTLTAIFGSSAKAQITRTWNTTSGNFGVASNWTPTGVPSPADTARFNNPNSNLIPVEFLDSQTIDELEILDGNITFRGDGLQGSNIRQLTMDHLNMTSGSKLWLLEGFDNRTTAMSVNDDLAVAGELNIFDGSRLSTSSDTFFDNVGGLALIRVTGENQNGDPSVWNGSSVSIGDVGEALMMVDSGAEANLSSIVVGREENSLGQVSIDGVGGNGQASFLDVSNFLLIGRYGNAEVSVTNGGKVQAEVATLGAFNDSTGDVTVSGTSPDGTASHWTGDVVRIIQGSISVQDGGQMANRLTYFDNGTGDVSGAGSRLVAEELLSVGDEQGFVLKIQNEAQVSSVQTFVGPEPGTSGTIEVSGSSGSQPGTFLNSGNLFLGGDDSTSGGDGVLDIQQNGRVEVGGTLKIWDGGTVNFEPFGTLDAEAIEHQNGGNFNFDSGVLIVDQFEGNLEQSGGALQPGGDGIGSTVVLGDFIQDAGKLFLEASGTAAGIEHDLVNVSGVMFFDGQFHVRLTDGFVPDSSDNLTLMVASNILGFFVNALNGQRVDTLDGSGSFVINYGVGSAFDENRVVLSDFEANYIVGDVNNDGNVDLLDIEPFIDAMTAGDFLPAADINQDGSVDLLDVEAFVELLTS